MIELEMPDGSVIEFPDGTTPEVMQKAATEFMGTAPKKDYRGTGAGAGTTAEAGIIGALDTLSLGFLDEGNAALRAIPDWLGGQPYGEAYEARLAHERGLQDQIREEDGGAMLAGQLGGALLLPGAAMRSGASLGANALRSGLTAGAQGAAYGFGSGEEDAASRTRSGLVGGLIGGAAGVAAPFALKGVEKALTRRATSKAIDAAADEATAAGAKAGSQAAFRTAHAQGVVLKPDATMPLVDEIAEIRTLHKRFTPDANGLIDDILDDLSKGKVPLDALEDLHRSAGMAVNKNRIANPQDAAAAGEIAKRIDEFLMGLPEEAVASATGDAKAAVEAFREGRRLWKAFRNSERLQEVVDSAQLKENPALAIRNGFRAILSNKSKRATFSEAEQHLMRQVISDSKAGNWVQRLIGYGTGLSRQVAAATAGYGVGGPVGAAVGSAIATKVGSMAKDAASDAALAAGERAARFSASGGQFVRPDPVLLPGLANALSFGARLPAPVGVNALTSR